MRSILITGGTGSFGQAFVRELLKGNEFSRIAILSRSEHKQAEMANAYHADPDKYSRLRFFIGDVRDPGRLRRAFSDVDVVVHAAALKRIEVGHYNPDEMVKTNVLGTMNVIEAAADAGVVKVVGLSSDKAFEPVSAYGQSKALAETLLMNANNTYGRNGPTFVAVRYGNVAGSAGSVIPKWREIIANGEQITLTDPECTRFWMFMHEAVGLVRSAIETGTGERILVPKLPAYRLGDLLVAMGGWLNTKITGLPSWEKLHEGMGPGNTSDVARRLTVDELRGMLELV